MQDTNQYPEAFAALGLPDAILHSLAKLGFNEPTPIQAQSIPALLEGKDILGEAQTGTGKTAAFGLPALAKIDPQKRFPQLLILAPTRELAIQVAEAVSSFASHMRGIKVATLYGGQPYGPQIGQLERGAQVVVATPGRLMDHIRRKTLKLDKLSFCVLDEADEMLNMGFLEDVEWILEHTPSDAQMALFSATMPPAIKKVTQKFLKNPVHVKIKTTTEAKPNISQKVWKVSGINKMTALERIVETGEFEAMLVFVRTRSDTLELADYLNQRGHKAAALNGDMNQQQRERTVNQLKKGQLSILIATDVVARGLDVPRITLVLNYDLPSDSESYVHRIGRTGRAGRCGEAISFARPRELRLLRGYERATGGSIEQMVMPSIEELGKRRVTQCKEELCNSIASLDLKDMRELVELMALESDSSVLDFAAALLFDKQRNKPLRPKPDPVARERRDTRSERPDRGNRRDRADSRGERNHRSERGARSERPRRERPKKQIDESIDWQTFRIEVGREHGAKPGDIVGAIANEVSLDSNYIGAIRLFDKHSHVQLPKGMPKQLFQHLQKVRIRSQVLAISAAE